MSSLQAVILAGGLATRLRPLTEKYPKSLVDINGLPFIDYQLRLLHRQNIRDIVLCVGYLGEMIQEYVGDGQRFGLSIQYVFDGPNLLGTGGALKKAADYLDDAFFVIYGDSYLVCDYVQVQKTFVLAEKQGLMTVFRNQSQWDTSNIEFMNGHIINYDKVNRTPNMHYIDYGLGILTQAALEHIPQHQPYDLAYLYQTLLREDQLAAYEIFQRFYEIGSLQGIEDFKTYLANQNPVAETA